MNKKKKEELFQDQVINYLESNTPGAVASKVVLATLALGGVMCVGAVAPNIFKAVHGCLRYTETGKNLKKKSCSSIVSRLKKDGLIYLEKQKNGSVKVLLTERGYQYVRDFSYRPIIKKPTLWDRKWRVVVFDIEVAKKREREMFRKEIKDMGFRQVQKSVWVHPYKCEDEVLFLAKQLHIDTSIEILTVNRMLHSEKWKKMFHL
jgi:CRISPR-associated endonuclease Cas2